MLKKKFLELKNFDMIKENNPFQSMHPMRGATAAHKWNGGEVVISLHAPHAGCDESP